MKKEKYIIEAWFKFNDRICETKKEAIAHKKHLSEIGGYEDIKIFKIEKKETEIFEWCGKILIKYYEIMDTKNNAKAKLCEECGLKLVDWLNNK